MLKSVLYILGPLGDCFTSCYRYQVAKGKSLLENVFSKVTERTLHFLQPFIRHLGCLLHKKSERFHANCTIGKVDRRGLQPILGLL